MNSEKWREVTLSREAILDLINTHLHQMTVVASHREITEIDCPGLIDVPTIKIKYKLKEVKAGADQA